MKLHETIAKHHNGDPDETTVAVFDAIGLPPKWRLVFYSIVRDECRRQGRAATLALITETTDGQHDPDTHGSRAVSRPRWLVRRNYCGDDIGYVLLGQMTVEQHRGRIAFQSALRNGITADINRHADWIELIESTPDAACLDDVYAAEVAA